MEPYSYPNTTLPTLPSGENNFSLLLHGNFTTDNYYHSDDNEVSFFDTYFSWPRFGVATTLAILSAAVSTLALISGANARKKRYSIYHTLFINLCVANILNSVLAWLCNNLFFLFSDELIWLMLSQSGICKVRTLL